MRKIFLLFAALCCTVMANAEEIIQNGIRYSLIKEYRQAIVVSNKTSQGNYANLQGKVTIPASIQYDGTTYNIYIIDKVAFCQCSTITSVTIEEGVYEIGIGAFRSCPNLESVTLPESVNSIKWAAFRDDARLTSLTLPKGLQVIPSEMCSYCPSLKSITLPENLVAIDTCAFLNCAALTSIVIPNKTALICNQAFFGCTSLETVDIPASVASIEEKAFHGCYNLETIKCRITPPLSINANVFENVVCANVSLHVPNQSVNAYKAHSVWKEFYVLPLMHTISFVVNGATVYSKPMEWGTPAATVKEEAKAVEQQMSIPAGKVFKHWNPEITAVTKDQAYEAVIEANSTITKCTISFVYGSKYASFLLDEGSPKSDVEYLAELFLEQIYVPMDMKFKYWEPELAAVTDNQTYNAVFGYIYLNYYTIKFVIDGKTALSVALKYGTEDWVVEGYANAVAANAVYPEGMTFKDWDKYFNKVTEDETYTARLRPIGEGVEQPTSGSSLKGGEKFLRDGQLLIERNGKIYNALGTEIQ